MNFISKYTAQIVISVVMLYTLIPFLAPIFFVTGYNNLGFAINEFYEYFCHQRVERSIFLFGEKKRYSIIELKEKEYITEVSNQWPEYYGHDYYGNEQIGYKVPICVRDIALYGAFIITSIILLLFKKRIRKTDNRLIALLSLPMTIDVLAIMIIELFDITSVPFDYIDGWVHRIITGILFGIAMSLLVIPVLSSNSLTKHKEKGILE